MFHSMRFKVIFGQQYTGITLQCSCGRLAMSPTCKYVCCCFSHFSDGIHYSINRAISKISSNELILSNHMDVVDILCMEGTCSIIINTNLYTHVSFPAKIKVHSFDDRESRSPHITPSSWFWRFTIEWPRGLPNGKSPKMTVCFFSPLKCFPTLNR